MSGTETTAPAATPRAKKPGRRTVTLTVSLATFVSGMLALVAGLVWIFILGVLLGRGHAPEERVPRLGGLMPGQTREAPTDTEHGADGILDKEDLVHNELKVSSRPGRREAPAAPGPAVRRTPPAVRADQPAPAAETPRPAAAPAFNYTYQVAAYKSEAPCQALVSSLRAAGLEAQTEKTTDNNGTWYKTLVMFRGTADDVDGLRAELAKHKITRIMLRAKSPVR